jgi:formylglycine-generating enzyme required for sulfatase activity
MGSPAEDEEGSADERPPHTVIIAKPFRLLRHEVTFEEYDHFAYATGRRPPNDSGLLDSFGSDERQRLPVINIPWREARAYAEWLTQSRQEKQPFRLPTEAEWEYAARAGTLTRRFWGDHADGACAHANVFDRGHEAELVRKYGSRVLTHPAHDCNDGFAFLAPVKALLPNPWRLYDMLGNVYEWVQDCYQETYEGAPQQGAAVEPPDCNKRVIRGGAWSFLAPKDVPESVRSASRFGVSPEMQHSTVGFRLAQDLE